MKINFASPFSDEVVIGENPEMADMGNPNGLIYGRRIFVEAVTSSGRRFIFGRTFESQLVAGAFASRVEAKGEINPVFWGETFPIYGSAAWEAEDAERAAHLRTAISAGDAKGIERYS